MRCKHGYLIHFNWDDCPDCREEAYEERQREESLEEMRKQTRLLEEMARRQRESGKS
ncbi:MAG: hypothetical protein QOH70_1940 [Blastocatellia bacterium]|jgi:hypothetical protein|nr:hypothetical protein [Blastocatellia bacterium]